MDGSCNLQGTNNRGSGAKTASNKALWSLCTSEIFSVAPLLCEPAFCLPSSSHGQVAAVPAVCRHDRNTIQKLFLRVVKFTSPCFFSCFFLLKMVDTSAKWYKDIGDTVICLWRNTFFSCCTIPVADHNVVGYYVWFFTDFVKTGNYSRENNVLLG